MDERGNSGHYKWVPLDNREICRKQRPLALAEAGGDGRSDAVVAGAEALKMPHRRPLAFGGENLATPELP